VDPPGGLKLLEGYDSLVAWGGPESPCESAIRCPEAIDMPVGAAEEDEPAVHGWRRIDSAVGGKPPELPAVPGVEGVERVFILGSHVYAFGGDYRWCESAG